MYNKYMLVLPIEKITLRNGYIVSSEVIDYSSFYPGNIIPHRIYKFEGNSPISFGNYHLSLISADSLIVDSHNKLFQTNYSYNKYPILDYTIANNKRIFYIWGYYEKYPIAKIENVSVDEVMNALNLSLYFTYADEFRFKSVLTQEQWDKINNLRNLLPNSLITTYTYRPLVGMTSITDPRGVTTYYEYDDFNRLKRTYIIENSIQKTMQNYDYHYQGQ